MSLKNKIRSLSISLSLILAANAFAQIDAPQQALKETNLDPLKEKISLDYKDADISTILRSLSYAYGLNLVTSTEIKGKVTISLKDITLLEALDAILTVNGYNYSQKNNIIYVSPGAAEGAQLVNEPITLKYIKAVEAQNLLRKAISPKGDIKVDEISNLFIITDYPASIEKIKALLKSIDIAPQQVLIEAKIVDITSKDLRNLGLTWQVDYNPGKGIFSRENVETISERLKGTATLAGPSSSLSGGQFKLDTLVLKGLSATATLDALIQDQKAHLLASPSIAVLNNREARIIIGEKVPYKERTQTTTGTTETTRFIDVGTTLRVTPSINADGYITLEVHPEVSSVSALLDAGPRITTREADTIVRIKEGDTLVIGGLIKQQDDSTHSRIPILGYIPVLSYFFSNRSKDQTQTELTVFVTPKIVRSREEIQASAKTPLQEQAAVDIMAVGNLNLQKSLFDKARNLQTGTGLEARRKDDWQRKYQALSLYEHIFTSFPDAPKAPEAGYQAARLYYELGEFHLARDLSVKVISDYPASDFAGKAKALYQDIKQHFEQELAQASALEEKAEVKAKQKEKAEAEVKAKRREEERQRKEARFKEQENLREEARQKRKRLIVEKYLDKYKDTNYHE